MREPEFVGHTAGWWSEAEPEFVGKLDCSGKFQPQSGLVAELKDRFHIDERKSAEIKEPVGCILGCVLDSTAGQDWWLAVLCENSKSEPADHTDG